MGMHAAPTPTAPGQPATEGCIGLSQRDIGDLYDILSIGSTVTIRR
jgi:lipoprotein-anchoring transpeptidase ErfK/SrfK